MFDYTGIKCPVCDKAFEDGDDVVVCPKCGAPYHRDCYNEKGECVFDDLHAKGEKWKAEPSAEKEKFVYEIKDKECPSCGVLNSSSASYCSSCGAMISQNHTQQSARPNMNNHVQGAQPQVNPIYGTGFTQFAFDPLGGVDPKEEISKNVTAGELSKVIQQNSRYYLPVFKKIKDQNKSKFNFHAFLFSGPWLLYRKQYKSGILATILLFSLYLGQTFVSWFISGPRFADILAELGIDYTSELFTNEQIELISRIMSPTDIFIIMLPTLMMMCMFLLMLIVGFNGNRMYFKHCVKTIENTKSTSANNEDYNTHIMEKGGVNTSVTLCTVICYILITYLPMYFVM
ncbi:MAG: RING finger protein [Clostridia bacterium]